MGAVLCALLSLTIVVVPASAASDEAAIRDVLNAYQEALNASSADAAVALYMDDGVLMPPYSQSIVGKAQLASTYAAGSKLFTLHVKFAIDEIVQTSSDWAFARTTSSGTHKVNSTGAIAPEANHELFILRRDTDGRWKIARYSFSSTNPLPR